MAINLQKGQTIDLRKNADGSAEYDLSQVTIGLGWDMRTQSNSFFGGGADYDLDAAAFLLDANGKIANLGKNMEKGDVVFFASKKHPSGHIWLTGDNLTGAGAGDDEQIIVKLHALDQRYEKIVFLVTIYQGHERGQHFGMVQNAFIRAVDARGKEIARYTMSGNPEYNNMCGLVFAEVYRRNGEWKFRALGDVKQTDSLVEILRPYA